jgi:hypothetical protein
MKQKLPPEKRMKCWDDVLADAYWKHPFTGHEDYALPIKQWDKIMTRKTYRVELKIDFEDDTRHVQMAELLKKTAREVYSVATLLHDGKGKPLIALISDDAFNGQEELGIGEEPTG